MVEEAKYINEKIDGKVSIKIPVTQQGIKAIKQLKREQITTLATAIFTADQALMAAKAGADWVAPYVNRIDNISGSGTHVVKQIHDLFKIHNLPTKILAASFKNVQQVHDVAIHGAESVTVNSDILDELLSHPLTDRSVEQFINDWKAVYGSNATCILD